MLRASMYPSASTPIPATSWASHGTCLTQAHPPQRNLSLVQGRESGSCHSEVTRASWNWTCAQCGQGHGGEQE